MTPGVLALLEFIDRKLPPVPWKACGGAGGGPDAIQDGTGNTFAYDVLGDQIPENIVMLRNLLPEIVKELQNQSVRHPPIRYRVQPGFGRFSIRYGSKPTSRILRFSSSDRFVVPGTKSHKPGDETLKTMLEIECFDARSADAWAETFTRLAAQMREESKEASTNENQEPTTGDQS